MPERSNRSFLTNLLIKWIKFTDAGEISIVGMNLPESGGVEISISDTGIGIPAEYLSKIFDPFCQVQADSTGQVSGVGLGLSIVKELVPLLQGEIRVQSVVGKGSIFTLFFPIDRD